MRGMVEIVKAINAHKKKTKGNEMSFDIVEGP